MSNPRISFIWEYIQQDTKVLSFLSKGSVLLFELNARRQKGIKETEVLKNFQKVGMTWKLLEAIKTEISFKVSAQIGPIGGADFLLLLLFMFLKNVANLLQQNELFKARMWPALTKEPLRTAKRVQKSTDNEGKV